MSRISRKNKVYTIAKTKKNTLQYKTAIYARLSIKDNGIDSDSLKTQIDMMSKFVDNHPQLIHFKTYYDNGATGTNFSREGFNEMLEDIKKGFVNCIIVKDLSRFGRNYIETGNYLENIFPYLGVRFISVSDNYDSLNTSANEALIIALKSVMHDAYAKDISRKICTLFDIKKKSGEYIGRYAPYGYKKSEYIKNKLIINNETAPIIKDIFKWRLEELEINAIAKRLNDLRIPSQYKYLYNKGLLKENTKKKEVLWHRSSIKSILENVIYLGCIIERKSEKALYKGGREVLIPKEKWNIIHNTHEAIIDIGTFEKVQKLNERRHNPCK